MNIIVIGSGRIGSTLAYQLDKKHHQVTIVQFEATPAETLPADFHGRVVEGDPLAQQTWHRAGIETADALAAVSNSDSINITVAHLARNLYQVPKVVIRNYSPHWQPALEAFGLEMVGSANLEVQKMQEMLSGLPDEGEA